jgi:putative flippase GtrA
MKVSRNTLKQVVGFGLVGVLNTLIDLAFFNLLISLLDDGGLSNLEYVISKSLSFIVAVVLSYILNARFVFKKSKNVKSLYLFLLVSFVGLLLNAGSSLLTVTILTQSMDQGVLLNNTGAIVGSVAAATWNFIAYKYMVFK